MIVRSSARSPPSVQAYAASYVPEFEAYANATDGQHLPLAVSEPLDAYVKRLTGHTRYDWRLTRFSTATRAPGV